MVCCIIQQHESIKGMKTTLRGQTRTDQTHILIDRNIVLLFNVCLSMKIIKIWIDTSLDQYPYIYNNGMDQEMGISNRKTRRDRHYSR